MRYQILWPRGRNGSLMEVHVDQELVRELVLLMGNLSRKDLLEEFRGNTGMPAKMMAFAKELKRVRGLTGEIFIDRYDIMFQKARLFSWDEIIPLILRALKKHVAKGGVLTEVVEKPRASKKKGSNATVLHLVSQSESKVRKIVDHPHGGGDSRR